MLDTTTFVIGAGASVEAGLPAGTQLLEMIARALTFRLSEDQTSLSDGDAIIFDTIQRAYGSKLDTYLEAAQLIKAGAITANSIDSFIDAHNENGAVQILGKISIVRTILEAERSSKLNWDKINDRFAGHEQIRKTWYANFFRRLNDGIRLNDVEKIFDKVALIIFNYDRCVEHFLFRVLQSHYGISEGRAASIVKRCKIFHPYGVIGDLEWQGGAQVVGFGEDPAKIDLYRLASGIRTYTEQVADRTIISEIRKCIIDAKNLVFLGFGYNRQNLELLTPDQSCQIDQILGTSLGLSPSDTAIIVRQLRQLTGAPLTGIPLAAGSHMGFGEPIYLAPLTCADIIEQYSRSIFS